MDYLEILDRKIERKKLLPIEGAGIAKLYLRLKNTQVCAGKDRV